MQHAFEIIICQVVTCIYVLAAVARQTLASFCDHLNCMHVWQLVNCCACWFWQAILSTHVRLLVAVK